MFIIALDIGGTNIRAAIADQNGKLLEVVKEKHCAMIKKFLSRKLRGLLHNLI